MSTEPTKRPWARMEIIGMALLILSMAVLFIKPAIIGGLFNSMFDRAYPIAIGVFVTSKIAAAIIISVTVGRLLERLGFTDALMRIFVPIMKYVGVNAAVCVPSIYNILGDVNAAGRIGGPILTKAGATKDEQKIAIATLMQNPSSFSIVVFGIIILSENFNVFLIFILGLLLPVIAVPAILRFTIWRDTKSVELTDLPVFTPDKPFLTTVYGAAREGAEVLLLLIVPAAAVVFAAIGALDYMNCWKPIEAALNQLMIACRIEPVSGTLSLLAGGTLAMVKLMELIKISAIPPEMIVGSFIFACSSPLQVIFGQIPIIWAGPTELNERECIVAAVIGAVFRLLTAAVFAYCYMIFA